MPTSTIAAINSDVAIGRRINGVEMLMRVCLPCWLQLPGPAWLEAVLVDDVTATIFNPWDNLAYAHTLTGLWPRWGLTEAQILRNPLQPLSLLYDAAGEPQSAAAAAEQLTVLAHTR